MERRPHPTRLDRREFFRLTGRGALRLGALGTVPWLVAACGRDEPAVTAPAGGGPAEATRGEVIVGDIVDHALLSDEWEGSFGFVTFRLHHGMFEGEDVYFIRTDTSDQGFAQAEGLVWAPKIAVLSAEGLTGDAYLMEGDPDQPAVLSSAPGQRDFTPAWRISRGTWKGSPKELTSVAELKDAEEAGDLTVEHTDIVLNGAVVRWGSQELPADEERVEYLGGGQLLEPPDTSGMRVTFKLHECYPGVRYIVADTSLEPMAEGMHIVPSPGLTDSPSAGATGRTNVFMNGLEGPGPMGFQPSVFDSKAGDPAWSPYWDHMTYAWTDGVEARVLTSEEEVHAARDAGQLEEFPGTPDTNGEVFTVNCPVPVLAPNTFRA
ncbi:MAG: DUF7482 domain-containing protein [Actinomycetota bacterium]